MKNSIQLFMLLAFGLFITLSACKKENNDKNEYEDFKIEEADLEFAGDGDFQKVVTNPLIKRDDCKYIVAGTIEFRKGDAVIAIIDFGDGICDNLATKTADGETTEFMLDKKEDKYKKVVVEPIVKIEGCEYIVSGIVRYYEGDQWVATVDFGDGTCDEWAMKTWDGGSKTFSMKKD